MKRVCGIVPALVLVGLAGCGEAPQETPMGAVNGGPQTPGAPGAAPANQEFGSEAAEARARYYWNEPGQPGG
jgi:hypothetical protein